MHNQGILPSHYVHPWPPLKGFKAYRIERGVTAAVSFARRDLYKIGLVTARSRVCYPGEEGNGHVLVFTSPNAAYAWERNAQGQCDYNCLFTKEFLGRHPRLMSLLVSSLRSMGNLVVYPLTQAQSKTLATVFQQILFAQDSDYVFKHELIANCLHLLTHEALKMQPSKKGCCF